MIAYGNTVPLPPVPLVDVQRQRAALEQRIRARIDAVLARGDFILGEAVRELEAELADYAGAGEAVAVANGTDALILPLMASGIGPGDAVFVPAFTFAATAGAVVLCGATPVFVDIDDDSLNMDPAQLETAIIRLRQDSSLRPRAIIPVDLFGRPADYAAIRALADHEGLLVLADAAQSFGARLDGQRVGALATVTGISFYPSKPLSCFGDGGAILTGDADLANACRALRGHGLDSAGEIRQVGMNSRLDSLQAAILLAKLEAFDAELAARKRAADWYTQRLAPYLRTPARPPQAESAWAVYAVRLANRDGLRAALAARSIASAIYYPRPLHLQPAYAAYGDGSGSLPVSEQVCKEILALPMHGYLDEATVARVCDSLIDALERV